MASARSKSRRFSRPGFRQKTAIFLQYPRIMRPAQRLQHSLTCPLPIAQSSSQSSTRLMVTALTRRNSFSQKEDLYLPWENASKKTRNGMNIDLKRETRGRRDKIYDPGGSSVLRDGHCCKKRIAREKRGHAKGLSKACTLGWRLLKNATNFPHTRSNYVFTVTFSEISVLLIM